VRSEAASEGAHTGNISSRISAVASSLGDVVNGDKPGRADAKERVIFIACGMAVFDISWGFELLQNARARGIGQSLNLWERPHQG
jgi:ornithine cyclodeaminase